jgi:L-fuconolactonase
VSRPPRIDAHQHFWALARGDYHWLNLATNPALGPIHRDFQPDELRPLLQAQGIHGSVLVQAAATVTETEYLLSLAAAHDFIRGVVGWVDLSAPDAVATLERLARHAAFKSVRPMLQDLPDPAWIATAAIGPAVQTLVRLGLCFDALVKTAHLPHLLDFARRHPALPIVIDHAAKPDMAHHELVAWRALLAPLAALPQVHCKLSGLVTEIGPAWQIDTLRPYTDAVLDLFGPQRVMWGSDWPVLNLAADYARWSETTHALMQGLDEDARAAVLGGNAVRFYRLAPRPETHPIFTRNLT